MDAEGRWYHRRCFKCMAPNCNASLTLRSFQMAALDDSIIDPLTHRPLKALVCKDHIPMLKHSINKDALSLKHTTSTPRPTIPGLHRSMMGSRGLESKDEDFMEEQDNTRPFSPRSLDQGSHAEIFKSLGTENIANSEEEDNVDSEYSAPTTTLPKFVHGRFTVSRVSDPVTASHVEAKMAQDPNKDDDSFRNIPVHHSDYEHKDGHTAMEAEDGSWDDDGDDDDNEEEDHKQERVFSMKRGDAEDATEQEQTALGDMTFSSKLMEHMKHGRSESKEAVEDSPKAVNDDEWDAIPTDSYSRCEIIAGM
ncbi:hypothetical protein BGZ54_005400 [Gamsiella multidivaricata]|nr:hypothetical protein BGZ54_005400 [Gamsiella multidivaricata]